MTRSESEDRAASGGELKRLVYVSSAARAMGADDLAQILEASRRNNARDGLTGMLLHRGGNFIQVLEGEAAAVDAAFARIAQDPRHGGIIVTLRENTAERQFAGWTMGYEDLTGVALATLPGFSAYLDQDADAAGAVVTPALAHRLLDMFRRTNR